MANLLPTEPGLRRSKRKKNCYALILEGLDRHKLMLGLTVVFISELHWVHGRKFRSQTE